MQEHFCAPKQGARRPRSRRCLLKGCEHRFQPRQANQRYCSEGCRQAARKWSRWKAQQRYRDTTAGKRKRNGQSRRYRDRVRSRPPADSEMVGEPARVITTEEFFRSFLRPARLLRGVRTPTTKSFTALLFADMPACTGAGPRPGAEVETGARFNPEVLIRRRCAPYIQPV